MKVYIYSQKDVEELLKADRFPKNIGIINIGDVLDQRSADYKSPTHDFLLLHCDMQGIFLHDSINELDAYRSALFIKRMYSNGCDIVCYSRNGKSRSPAYAAAILEFYYNNGSSIFTDSRYTPNKLIYDKLLDALRKENI
ncbi:MAG: hypothetical protein IKJ59_02820 [Clostridia bacterium]|nr:hypothetical protein [Clostridia bacterium]